MLEDLELINARKVPRPSVVNRGLECYFTDLAIRNVNLEPEQ